MDHCKQRRSGVHERVQGSHERGEASLEVLVVSTSLNHVPYNLVQDWTEAMEALLEQAAEWDQDTDNDSTDNAEWDQDKRDAENKDSGAGTEQADDADNDSTDNAESGVGEDEVR